MSEILIVMAKAPKPGFSKTRLHPPLTPLQAAELYETCLADVLDAAASFATVVYMVGADGRYQQRFPELPQHGRDLGEKMQNALAEQLCRHEKAVLIGCDAPQIDAALLRDAFRALDRADVVFGPANDGGYYLVGLRAPQPALFDGLPWGSERVLAESLAICDRQKLAVELLPELIDIDTWEDVLAIYPRLSPALRLSRLLHSLLG